MTRRTKIIRVGLSLISALSGSAVAQHAGVGSSASADSEHANAERKAMEAKVSLREAAEAFRSLAALQALRDPKKALATIEEAVRLDPENIQGLRLRDEIRTLAEST